MRGQRPFPTVRSPWSPTFSGTSSALARAERLREANHALRTARGDRSRLQTQRVLVKPSAVLRPAGDARHSVTTSLGARPVYLDQGPIDSKREDPEDRNRCGERREGPAGDQPAPVLFRAMRGSSSEPAWKGIGNRNPKKSESQQESCDARHIATRLFGLESLLLCVGIHRIFSGFRRKTAEIHLVSGPIPNSIRFAHPRNVGETRALHIRPRSY
jgi:hypothetical protein